MIDGLRMLPVSGHPMTLIANADGVSGTEVCNTYGARIEWDDIKFRVADGVSETLVRCPEDSAGIENAFSSCLARAQTQEIVDGRLVILGPGVELRFAPLASLPSSP